jgi:hypothetical protein
MLSDFSSSIPALQFQLQRRPTQRVQVGVRWHGRWRRWGRRPRQHTQGVALSAVEAGAVAIGLARRWLAVARMVGAAFRRAPLRFGAGHRDVAADAGRTAWLLVRAGSRWLG